MAAAIPIGYKILERRKEKGLTLQQLAELTDLTPGYLSQIEHDKASPSISSLKALADALDLRIIDLFADDIIKEPKVMTEDQWPRVYIPDWQSNTRRLTRIAANKRMQPFFTIIEPGGACAGAYAHPGEEFVFVIEGELTFTIGEEVHRVGPMTALYYSSLQKHSWKNEGSQPCKLLWVLSPPSF